MTCAGFPAELGRRTYPVSIQMSASPDAAYNFNVVAAEPKLRSSNLFGFGVAGQFVGFEFDNGFTGFPEEFPGFRYLWISGNAPTAQPATSTGTEITIPFWGTFSYCQLNSPVGIYNDCSQIPGEKIVDYHVCSSQQDSMVLTKR
jgi:hypothetical protein